MKQKQNNVFEKIYIKILIAIGIIALLGMMFSCADTRHMAKYYDRMEAGQVSDTVYAGDGNGIFEIN